MRRISARVIRRLLRAPTFTAVAVFTLALGIGANTAIFSVVRGVLLKPLPFQEADRLVGVWLSAPGLGIPRLNLSPATYLIAREEGRVFEEVGLWAGGSVSVTGSGEPERVTILRVTDGTLKLLRVNPVLGRTFSADDDSPRTPERVLLSHGYWQRRFGSDTAIVGKPVVVDGSPREIVGVLPADFSFLDMTPQLVLPFRFDRARLHVANFSYQGVVRLEPGVTIEQANADVARLIPLLPERFPMPPGFTRQMFEDVKMYPKVRPLAEDVIGDVAQVLWVLLGTVGLVLLIACRSSRSTPRSARARGASRGSCSRRASRLRSSAARSASASPTPASGCWAPARPPGCRASARSRSTRWCWRLRSPSRSSPGSYSA